MTNTNRVRGAIPRPFDLGAGYADGARRALVLGGGGLYFIAWQVAYLRTLEDRGARWRDADVIVGTSAGSVLASVVAAGGLRRLAAGLQWLTRAPRLSSLLAPSPTLRPSQTRALELFASASDSRPATVRRIGHAALAADTPPPGQMRRAMAVAIAVRGWPSSALRMTTVDAFTGHRCVVDAASGVSAVRGAAASSAVPGLFAPQPVGDRRCIDGGVSGSGTHCDLAAGAKRAMVVSLTAHVRSPVPAMTIQPNATESEIEGLEAAGTVTMLRGPHQFDLARLMDPAAVADGLRLGAAQAEEDADQVRRFWVG